ncbi:carboxypeptidase-like regulatory domain family protein [Formosa agariphila KMM 3901]|uniref:Carboxypeptidase-like regulatory domain family protein n=1 Tax=Formosa agariphila (strain DSM 15362 / KCTC 12365 / LMG 23005 / KMM 3901 / M-2Alg 35-1) TaxID=1347342 RepID=T2KJM9_FORAG|nr:carboxypeptidase [Formosa agariphila]CDF79097.1 carboxypeptidase-like regulatory domain family protein [Formosa agariphila KMM 3901]
MKQYLNILFVLLSISVFSQSRKIPIDTMVVTTHTSTIKGKSISYTATTGTQPVWDKNGNPIASLYYTYYERNNVKNSTNRPLLISFNGGPGSASVWMHIAYTGPKVLNLDDEGYPVQPYGVKDNPNSILDIADIVYVNPVNTGYSRMIADKEGKFPDRKVFFGINADIKYLAEWVNTFVTRKNRWESPKYLIGESYGGTRVMGLAKELQNSQWMYLNGVIMVSPADYKLYSTGQPIYSALNLPYFTATAWHHKVLPPELQQKDLLDILPEVENYSINTLMPAIAKGGFISETEKKQVADKVAYYSGLKTEEVLQSNLEVPNNYFWKSLLRDKTGQTVGRLDSRYLGIDKTETGISPDYNAEISSWSHSFTPAINYYLREHLNFKTDIKYNMFGNVHPWNKENNNVREGLRQAMAQNPYLKVLIQSGYYDGATTYFAAKYTMGQIDPSGKMKDRFTFKGYRSGHMMYLRKDDLKTANDDIREFIKTASSNGKAAKYTKD